MKLLITTIFLSAFFLISAQEKTALEFQSDLNKEYADSANSPLLEADRLVFAGLPFFDIDNNYRFEADFKKSNRAKPFKMKTTTDRLPEYKVYGTATFKFKGKMYTLNIYQNLRLKETEEYGDYLFLPFKDHSNGNETYGGGRFIDLKIPDSNILVIDFNKAYNPLCAYNHKYSCPIPPEENHLDFAVEAGVKYIPHDE